MKNKNINKSNAILLNLNYFFLNSIFNNYVLIVITFLFHIVIILRNNLYNSKNNLQKKSLLKNRHLFVLILFFMLSLLLAFVSGNFNIKFGTTLLVFIQIILIFLSVKSTNNKNELFQYFCKYFIKFAFLFSLYAIILYFLGNKYQTYNTSLHSYIQSFKIFGFNFFQTSLGGDTPGTYNVGSLFSNPNTLSYTCLIAIIMSLLFLSNEKKIKVIITDLFLIVGLIISGSRLAVLLAILIIPIYLLTTFIGKKAIYKVLLITIFIFGLIALVYNLNYILTNVNFNGRLELWKTGISNIHFLGGGLNSDNLLIQEKLHSNISMHNSYISFALNFGILPLIIFLLYIFSTINKSVRQANGSIVSKVLIVLLIVFLIFSLSEYTFFACSSYNLVFFMILYCCNDNIDKNNEDIINF